MDSCQQLGLEGRNRSCNRIRHLRDHEGPVQSCPTGPYTYGKSTTTYQGFSYHDPSGGVHPFGGIVTVVSISNSSCGTVGTTITPIANKVATDNSGYIVTTNSSSALGARHRQCKRRHDIVDAERRLCQPEPGWVKEANGNQISISSGGVITDTLGMTALTVTGTPSTTSYIRYAYSCPWGPRNWHAGQCPGELYDIYRPKLLWGVRNPRVPSYRTKANLADSSSGRDCIYLWLRADRGNQHMHCAIRGSDGAYCFGNSADRRNDQLHIRQFELHDG